MDDNLKPFFQDHKTVTLNKVDVINMMLKCHVWVDDKTKKSVLKHKTQVSSKFYKFSIKVLSINYHNLQKPDCL